MSDARSFFCFSSPGPKLSTIFGRAGSWKEWNVLPSERLEEEGLSAPPLATFARRDICENVSKGEKSSGLGQVAQGVVGRESRKKRGRLHTCRIEGKIDISGQGSKALRSIRKIACEKR